VRSATAWPRRSKNGCEVSKNRRREGTPCQERVHRPAPMDDSHAGRFWDTVPSNGLGNGTNGSARGTNSVGPKGGFRRSDMIVSKRLLSKVDTRGSSAAFASSSRRDEQRVSALHFGRASHFMGSGLAAARTWWQPASEREQNETREHLPHLDGLRGSSALASSRAESLAGGTSDRGLERLQRRFPARGTGPLGSGGAGGPPDRARNMRDQSMSRRREPTRRAPGP